MGSFMPPPKDYELRLDATVIIQFTRLRSTPEPPPSKTLAMGYDEDVEKTTILDIKPAVRPVEPPTSRATRVLVCVVLAFAAAGALVAFQAPSTDHHVQKVEIVEPLTLASVQASQPALPADTPNPFMLSGTEFMILCRKDNKCVDDDQKIYLYQCDPAYKNQQFKYEADTRMIRDTNKNTCWESNGGWFRLAGCSASPSQQFLYDWTSRSFRSPSRPGKCVNGGDPFTFEDCDIDSPAQQFEIVPKGYY